MSHQHFTHETSTTSHRLYDDQDRLVTVQWTVNCHDKSPRPPFRSFSTLEITRNFDAPGDRYSLYTLGAQNRLAGGEIDVVSPVGAVKLTNYDGTDMSGGVGGPYVLEKTDIITGPLPKPNPQNMKFVQFSGTKCVLIVTGSRQPVSGRLSCRDTHPAGHEYLPPQPEPGGEN